MFLRLNSPDVQNVAFCLLRIHDTSSLPSTSYCGLEFYLPAFHQGLPHIRDPRAPAQALKPAYSLPVAGDGEHPPASCILLICTALHTRSVNGGRINERLGKTKERLLLPGLLLSNGGLSSGSLRRLRQNPQIPPAPPTRGAGGNSAAGSRQSARRYTLGRAAGARSCGQPGPRPPRPLAFHGSRGVRHVRKSRLHRASTLSHHTPKPAASRRPGSCIRGAAVRLPQYVALFLANLAPAE